MYKIKTQQILRVISLAIAFALMMNQACMADALARPIGCLDELRPLALRNSNRQQRKRIDCMIDLSGDKTDGKGIKVWADLPDPEHYPGKRPIVFLFHGLSGFKTERHIDAIAERFISGGYIVVRPDFRNNFRAQKPQNESAGTLSGFSIDSEIEDVNAVFSFALRELADRADFGEGYVVGQSCGGFIGRHKVRTYDGVDINIRALVDMSGVVSVKGLAKVILQSNKPGEDPEDAYKEWKRLGNKYHVIHKGEPDLRFFADKWEDYDAAAEVGGISPKTKIVYVIGRNDPIIQCTGLPEAAEYDAFIRALRKCGATILEYDTDHTYTGDILNGIVEDVFMEVELVRGEVLATKGVGAEFMMGLRSVASSVLRPIAALERDDADMSLLATSEGRRIARIVSGLLDELRFDFVNSELRSKASRGDYLDRPFPLPISAVGVEEIRRLLTTSVGTSSGNDKTFFRRVRFAYEFFVFGTSLSDEQFDILFGGARDQKDRFFRSGLIVRRADGRIRMNNMSLVSRRLENGKIMYLFVDTPPYFASSAAPERVYIGSDSYVLMDKVSKIPSISGYCVDLGSGSGIQAISMLLQDRPGIERAIGVEIDARARNMSIFNAFMNGVDDRFVVVSDEDGLRAALGGNLISFAVSNPPFIAIPELVEIDPSDEAALSGLIRVVRNADGRPCINLKELYARAGWGGEDGLEIIKKFIDMLLPLAAPKGRVAIYAQFAGNASGRTKIMDYLVTDHPRSLGVSNPVFERLPQFFVSTNQGLKRANTSQTSDTFITSAVAALIEQHREFAEHMEKLIPVFRKLSNSIRAAYERQGITNIHDGFVYFDKGSVEPAKSSDISRGSGSQTGASI